MLKLYLKDFYLFLYLLFSNFHEKHLLLDGKFCVFYNLKVELKMTSKDLEKLNKYQKSNKKKSSNYWLLSIHPNFNCVTDNY